MKSNYRRLGDLITEFDERNISDKDLELWGVSIDKKFIKSVANIIGTDLSKYKVINKDCFVCSLMQVSRDEKIPIARWNNDYSVLVSPAYKVFRITDSKVVLPEYMNLWFKRAEFDREASFYGVGGVRGSLEWTDFCDMRLPVPSLAEQQKIVDAYNTIEHRIELKRKINDNLVDLAKCTLSNALSNTDNVSYQPLFVLCSDIKAGGTPSRNEESYWQNGNIPWVKNGEVKNNIIISTEEHITQLGFQNSSAKYIPKHSVLMAMYCVSTPQLAYTDIDVTTNQAVCSMIFQNEILASYLYYYLMFFGQELINDANGSAQINLNKEQIGNYSIPVLNEELIVSLGLVENLNQRTFIAREIDALITLSNNLLTQLSR